MLEGVEHPPHPRSAEALSGAVDDESVLARHTVASSPLVEHGDRREHVREVRVGITQRIKIKTPRTSDTVNEMERVQ